MELIPTLRLAAGLPPLVTPTSQIVGAQAVACAMDEKAGRPMYTTKSSQFVGLVKGEYGKTPRCDRPRIPAENRPAVREETPYDTSKYQMQPNPRTARSRRGETRRERKGRCCCSNCSRWWRKTYLTGVKAKAYEAKKAARSAESGDEGRGGPRRTADYGQYGQRTAAGPYSGDQGQSRRQRQGRSGDRRARSDEDGKLHRIRLRRER